ncbi:MAG TPA: hypothetical protein DC049_06470 [Spirochaetia bacterium]|nr:hypothetical protein [Spirochaetia bacterium]
MILHLRNLVFFILANGINIFCYAGWYSNWNYGMVISNKPVVIEICTALLYNAFFILQDKIQ